MVTVLAPYKREIGGPGWLMWDRTGQGVEGEGKVEDCEDCTWLPSCLPMLALSVTGAGPEVPSSLERSTPDQA